MQNRIFYFIKHILSMCFHNTFQKLSQVYFPPKPVTCERPVRSPRLENLIKLTRDCKLSHYRQGCQVGHAGRERPEEMGANGQGGKGSGRDRAGGIVIHFVLWSLLAPLN